jgi:hypothetical protein
LAVAENLSVSARCAGGHGIALDLEFNPFQGNAFFESLASLD